MAASQDVEAVENEADGGMVGAAHRLPGIAIVGDMAAPSQRLEADAQATPGRPLAQGPQILGGPLEAASAHG